MKQGLLVLDSDKEYAKKRIAEIEAEIQALGPEFRAAFTQTSETWHDNAPFEAVRDQQDRLSAERHQLKQILLSSLPSIPKQKKTIVGIGSKVSVENKKNGKISHYYIAGDWTPRAGQTIDGSMVVSRKSPIADALFGKKVGDEIKFKTLLTIIDIDQKL
ncbi:MAG: GreA/GreB family elongation factor [Thiobacillus sp.]